MSLSPTTTISSPHSSPSPPPSPSTPPVLASTLPKTPPLRDYQEYLVEQCRWLLAPVCGEGGKGAGKQQEAVLMYLPTGGGKTRVAAELIRSCILRGGRVLFLVNRLTLLNQTRRALAGVGIPLTQIALLSGSRCELSKDSSTKVLIASVQTMWARLGGKEKEKEEEKETKKKESTASTSKPSPSSLEWWLGEGWKERKSGDEGDGMRRGSKGDGDASREESSSVSPSSTSGGSKIDLVVLDEAHGGVARTVAGVCDFYRKRGSRVLGLTATPSRLDPDEDLADVFSWVECGPSISELVRRRILAEPRVVEVETLGDVEGMRSVGKLVKAWETYGERRKTIVFAKNVTHAHSITRCFMDRGVRVGMVEGQMKWKERERVLEGLRQGVVEIVVSVNVLSEGFDEPSVSCILLARPTASLSLYIQQVGRGLRPYPNKKNCIILDQAGNTRKHGPVAGPLGYEVEFDKESFRAREGERRGRRKLGKRGTGEVVYHRKTALREKDESGGGGGEEGEDSVDVDGSDLVAMLADDLAATLTFPKTSEEPPGSSLPTTTKHTSSTSTSTSTSTATSTSTSSPPLPPPAPPSFPPQPSFTPSSSSTSSPPLPPPAPPSFPPQRSSSTTSTTELSKDPLFCRACADLHVPVFEEHWGTSKWERTFLASIASLITPGKPHPWKKHPSETKRLSKKQRQILQRITTKHSSEEKGGK